MKSIILSVLLLSMTFGFAQETRIIQNPGQPVKKDTGKTLRLKEVLQIHDIGEGYYFKYPSNIKISSTGDIFLTDERQLLKFDADGKFLKNFHKHGQGPMEVTYVSNYLVEDEKLIIHDRGQGKIVVINHENGELVKEFKVSDSNFSNSELIYHHGNRLYFLRNDIMETKGKLKVVDVETSLMSLSSGGTRFEKRIGFSVKYFYARGGEDFFISRFANVLTCPVGAGHQYFSHTPGYSVKLYSYKTNSIVREITRKYKRVEVTKKTRKYAPGGNYGKVSISGGKQWFKLPVPKYHLDIQALYIFKNRLWVVTSTSAVNKNNNTRILVDVFDGNGVYTEKFYIECPSFVNPFRIRKWIMKIDSDYLYAIEEDDDGLRFIKKYKIEGWHK